MTGTSVDEERMVAERLLAEQLMDLPDISCVTGQGSSFFLPLPDPEEECRSVNRNRREPGA
jgi:hypothetical protein